MNREKQSAALTSLAAAIALTTFKIVVGWSTGSLGILAEAAHSGLDLIAALMTVFAIRWAERPADATHPYGHGRIETVSALFETMLLIVTCGWIVNEAVRRLWGGQIDIEVNVWSFTVVLTSIVVDVSRSRVLAKAAEKFKSEALEADALHFRTDIWSSSVVLLGLICVTIAHRWPALTILESADAIAALFVAGITLYVSLRLGIRTVHALIDTVPPDLQQRIQGTAEGIPGVLDCHNIRIRYVGAVPIVDVHATLDGNQTLREAHDLTERIEAAIQTVVPDADVTVHAEPHDPRANG
jgi:cation diffusion facilitator family transporter